MEKPQEPTLSEAGIKEAQELIEKFKVDAVESLKKALSDVYCDLTPHIESDAWTNYRQQLQQALSWEWVDNKEILSEESHWAKNVRARILKEYQAELLPLLNKELVEQNERLKTQIKQIYANRF